MFVCSIVQSCTGSFDHSFISVFVCTLEPSGYESFDAPPRVAPERYEFRQKESLDSNEMKTEGFLIIKGSAFRPSLVTLTYEDTEFVCTMSL